jgi:WD40 repeat protein
MSLRAVSVFFVLSVACGATIAACGVSSEKGDDVPEEDASTSADTDPDASGFDPDAGEIGDRKIVKITVDPDGKKLEVVNGDVSAASIAYTATVTYSDGATAPEPACTWTVDRIDLGSFTGSTFRASGSAGGTGKVTCAAHGLSASATFSVFLRDEIDTDSGLDAASKAGLIASAAPDPSVKQLLYPYDKTVFPRGLPSPELMWNGATATDAYALRLELSSMTFTSYFKATTPARTTIPKASWTKLLDTATPTDPLKVTLYRMSGGAGGTPYKSTSQTWQIAAANLKGTIYYWRINGGRIVRIKPGATAPDDFLKTTNATGGCVACHSVSHDGSTLAASYEKTGPLSWVTFDVATGNEKYYAAGSNSGFQAITPDGSAIVTGSTSGSTLQLFSGAGTSLEPSGVAAFGNTVIHPTFSPDGKSLAFGIRKDGNWVDFLASDLAIAPFDPTTNKFGAMTMLRAAGGRVRTYPTFSPDAKWIAYMEGRTNPVNPVTASSRPAFADLHLIRPDGTDDVILATAGGAGVTDVDKSLNYEPTFGPVVSGGYFWIVFVSSRQYGNRINKTFDAFRDKCGEPSWAATPCRNKQLWVTAIDADPKAGVDPSHPAFWLPGQDLADQNMRGYWALDPCKKLGEGCEAGFECCEGTCKSEDGTSPKVCVKPPPGKCRELGDTCKVTSDCCDAALGVECIGGVCGKKLPS